MKFIVCIKQVPDVTAPLQIKDGVLTQESDRLVLDAYSASAVEEALVITEKHGGSVEALCAGPDKAKETIRKALAMGAASASHIVLEDGNAYDSLTYAHMLASHLKTQEFDVVLVGKQSQDSDAGLTGGMLAELLELPFATNAVGLDFNPETSKLTVKRQGDSGQEMIDLPTPCLVTCSNDMNDPRIPSLKGIMKSKKKPVQTVSLESLGLDATALAAEMTTTVVGYEALPEREPGKKLEGDAEELVHSLVNSLENEAKVL